ncbi:MAG: hypothetical protein R3248_01535 [Candidatus Promineifilaceae bacterium]|nr:hypothetical protein [Candidatus Promineifilaceae bacterium]
MLNASAKAPDFTLPQVDGEPIHLYDALEEGPAILIFLRYLG